MFAAYRALFWPQFGRPQHANGLLAVTDSLVTVADQIGDLQAMVEARFHEIFSPVPDRRSDWSGTRSHRPLRDVRTLGLRAERALARCVHARVEINAADFDAAMRSGVSALEIAGEDESTLLAYGAQQIEILRWRGDAQGALRLLDLAGADPAGEIENYLPVMRAVLLSESDHAASRHAEIEELSAQGFSNLTGIGSWTRVLELAGLADVACTQNNRGLGAAVLNLLADWSGLFLQVTLIADWGPCDLYMGKLARLLGDYEGAVHYLEGALRKCEDADLTTWAVLTSIQLGGALADGGLKAMRRGYSCSPNRR